MEKSGGWLSDGGKSSADMLTRFNTIHTCDRLTVTAGWRRPHYA